MMKKVRLKNVILLVIISCLIVMTSCNKKRDESSGKLTIKFSFSVDNENFQQDTLKYRNAADNLYEVNEIKFFISDFTLHTSDNQSITIKDNNSIHYTDYDLPKTLTWAISDEIAVGTYKTISFRFGLSDEKNKTHYFVNPPESNMSWPDALGGGYHYMMINGKWLKNNILTPFNFHLGRGQQYDGENITGFIDNSFVVTVPASSFTMDENGVTLTLNMNINNWFCTPEIFDFNHFGGAIMTNQTAQEVARANGQNVFSIKKN